jgi:hypothetical protein
MQHKKLKEGRRISAGGRGKKSRKGNAAERLEPEQRD